MSEKDWLKSDNIERPITSDHIIGEWARFAMLESRTLLREELFVTRSCRTGKSETLESAIAQVPNAFWTQGRVALDNDADPRPMMRNLLISLVGDCSEMLMFDPVVAQQLGWSASSGEPFTFRDKSGVPMVTTIFWRDGWEQEMRNGEGTGGRKGNASN